MPNIFFLMLRRLRTPIITLILIYAVSVFGLVLIPGVDNAGQPYRMDFFHAIYFISYTATTIGFGEIPYAFTSAQRMWVLVCIYLAVIGWAYALSSIFALTRDQALTKAIQYTRFTSKVKRMNEPFYLICGYGQTGRILCQVLDTQDIRFVVIDLREERINDVALADYHFDAPFYAGDAANPELLKIAGLSHPRCIGVLGITGNENTNLSIAITAYVLRPKLLSICRSKNQEISDNMASFGTNKVINMFEAVGQQFQLAMHAPAVSHLRKILSDFPGNPFPPSIKPPKGHWVIVGYGRFGRSIHKALSQEGISVHIIDPDPQPELDPQIYHQALGVDAASLKTAGIEHAVGLFVCHDDDANNLSSLATARAINPALFIVARQNLATNHLLFKAFAPDFISIRSEVVAHEALRAMANPLLAQFVLALVTKEDEWARQLTIDIDNLCQGIVPEHWTVRLNAKNPAAVQAFLARPLPSLQIKHFYHSVIDHGRPLQCIALLRRHGEKDILLPKADDTLRYGDELLFIGDHHAQQSHQAMCSEVSLMEYARTGVEQPQSWIFRKIATWRERS
ncbi:TrkA family potassium uptake protein [uncultured Deefgea sp.]|uniref:potassium channel family protein n=1 Tax=uncultured Deefgea sp. TaxID=1304914 RepID=UPI00259460E2|nr:NAD-binding protein [uncultured Deefgea sp.]